MEYSDLVQALKDNNSSRVSELLKTLMPRLIRFLQVHMNASGPDAEDCAQEALLTCLEAINEDNLRNPERVFYFLMSVSRNSYLKLMENKEYPYDDIPETSHQKPGQLLSLLDKERNKILERCMEQLSDEFREYIRYWFKNPDSDAESVADHFGITLSNAWTRKHRIIKSLHECYQKKSKL